MNSSEPHHQQQGEVAPSNRGFNHFLYRGILLAVVIIRIGKRLWRECGPYWRNLMRIWTFLASRLKHILKFTRFHTCFRTSWNRLGARCFAVWGWFFERVHSTNTRIWEYDNGPGWNSSRCGRILYIPLILDSIPQTKQAYSKNTRIQGRRREGVSLCYFLK